MSVPALRTHLVLHDMFRQEYLAYYKVLPLEVVDGRVRVAVSGNPEPNVLEDLGRTFDAEVEPVPTDSEQLLDGIRSAFATAESVSHMFAGSLTAEANEAVPRTSSVADARDQANQAPVIRYVNLAIRDAFESGASDIHLDATPGGLRVRLRIDGVLFEYQAPPSGIQIPILSRIKLLAELDIAERRVPQDGRVRVRLDNQELDLRIAVVPALHGESVVIRLLDGGAVNVDLEGLGMDPETFATVSTLTQKANGVVLTTGPTGSGKTTTLYGMLGRRRVVEEKLITIEDPIEYYLDGVTQIPIRSGSGFGFVDVLRSILRHDPDVIMVGEMRDAATAAVAVQAALTGHLVLSSLHTNDAAAAVTRLIDLGVDPYILAATLEGIVAQRLVRRICRHCSTRYWPGAATVSVVAGRSIDDIALYRGIGCSECRNTGYRGRIGIFEVLVLDDTLKRHLASGHEVDVIRHAAAEGGMRTLRQDAWNKVSAGATTVEEVIRVLGA